ncbi:haloacid dehalogenase type II [Pseudomonas oligotrophica]|uniref:haloacid dehalogenase type II n=1 Tax=Pseudomonas oligotrophica TaxID=2912055 RepID=UPI001EFFE343|nr:haloacid dehalogenase type II [Pseudomonas oligotrophica]MCF7202384.1 haloacid dehalogenase type II [Pseudomonas oligotrophica]
MIDVVAFDIYGTLIDTQAIQGKLATLVGEQAPAVTRLWRQKQLEYSFRRGLMRDYRDFSVCTRDALVYACREFGVTPDEPAIERMMAAYAELDAFAEVADSLQRLAAGGRRLVAFSNGSRAAVERLLEHAGIREVFAAVVSVEAVGTFKPAPEVYAHLCQVCESAARDVCLVSGNPFDILGAAHAGLRSAWLQRDPATQFDPWGVEPDIRLASLDELQARLDALQ